MQTLLLDRSVWDLLIDARGNIAVASNPYSLAQDAASAIKTFQGECYFNTTLGVPYLTQLLGKNVPLAILKQFLINAALTVPDVVSAQVFITAVQNRTLNGQVQVVSTSGETSVQSPFSTTNPQGAG